MRHSKPPAETAPHEAAILAALMKFTAHPDYGSAAEPEYQQFAGVLTAAGASLSEAAQAGDLTGFRGTLDGVGNACNNCHTKYRFGN